MKTHHVVVAIIRCDGLILATQRGYADQKGCWEFPGSKHILNRCITDD